MAGIAGIAKTNEKHTVLKMLDTLSYRGKAGQAVIELDNATVGIVWNKSESVSVLKQLALNKVRDGFKNGHFAVASCDNKMISLSRDELGVAPLYYGQSSLGSFCFSSEVKALLPFLSEIREFPPGSQLENTILKPYFQLKPLPISKDSPDKIAEELRSRMEQAVSNCIHSETTGAWLSGGLDSSIIAALVRNRSKILHTFSGGFKGAPDLKFAREVASFLKSQHHEIVITFAQALEVIPKVIYHLESFDALLVRSSIINYLVAKAASDYLEEVFSGEGADEFFAGYDYLKQINKQQLSEELIDIACRLHNTALQRVDRCASAHGTTAHTIFTDPSVFNYAMTIPIEYKLYNGIEKWILRRTMEGVLPDKILNRKKAKFWEGAGITDKFANYAMNLISNHDFNNERFLYNGWKLNTKEELMYYRIFKDFFGTNTDLSWMGRTKGSPEDR